MMDCHCERNDDDNDDDHDETIGDEDDGNADNSSKP